MPALWSYLRSKSQDHIEVNFDIRYSGHLKEVTNRYSCFSAMRDTFVSAQRHRTPLGKRTRYDVRASFMGKTGYGKSSTLNSLLDKRIVETSDVISCTTKAQGYEFKIKNDNYLCFVDLPGIGENITIDDSYMRIYRKFAIHSDVIVYILRADTRDYAIDESVFRRIFQYPKRQKKLVIALNCCDKIEPINRSSPFEPTKGQLKNIESRVNFITEKFQPFNSVIPYSATSNWNMEALAAEMARVMLTSDC